MFTHDSSNPAGPLVSIVLFVVVLLLLALASFVIKAGPRAPESLALALANLATAVWVLGVWGLQLGTDLRFWLAIAFFGASFIPAALLWLVRHYPVRTTAPSLVLIAVVVSLGASFGYLAIATSLLFSRPRIVGGQFVRDTGP
jgi:hypothetical protein